MLTTAAAAFFIVALVRSFRRVKVLMIDGVKPFACDLCMSFWGAVLAGWWRVLYAHDWTELVGSAVEIVAGAGLCLLTLKVLERIPELFQFDGTPDDR